MKFVALAIAALVGTSSAFVAPMQARVSVNTQLRMSADCAATIESLQGPVVYWGSAGVALGHEESDIKGYDNFTKFSAALKSTGVADTLKGSGPYTVFAPTDKAMESFKGDVTAELIKNHIVEGTLKVADINKDVQTMGKKLTYGRRFRKTFLDEAMVGIISSGASKGQVYPCDVAASNGIVHSIDVVLE